MQKKGLHKGNDKMQNANWSPPEEKSYIALLSTASARAEGSKNETQDKLHVKNFQNIPAIERFDTKF